MVRRGVTRILNHAQNCYGFSDLVPGNQRGVPLTPLREKSGAPLAPATQDIAVSRVNVMDPCATFSGDLAQGFVASVRGPIQFWSASVSTRQIGHHKIWRGDTDIRLPAFEAHRSD
jgi:hypothetical protein